MVMNRAVAETAKKADLLALLQRASRTLDHLWSDALSRESESECLSLGDASLALHRALIALEL